MEGKHRRVRWRGEGRKHPRRGGREKTPRERGRGRGGGEGRKHRGREREEAS